MPSASFQENFICQNITYALGDVSSGITSVEFSPNTSLSEYTSTEGTEKLTETLISADSPPGGSVDPKATMDDVTGTSGTQAAGRDAKQMDWTVTFTNGSGKDLILNGPSTTIDPANPDTSMPSRYDLTYEMHETSYGAGDSWTLKWQASS